MTNLGKKPLLVIVGQTPPPWHGQAVATQLLFDAKWDGYDVRTVRMAFSEEMEDIGRVHFKKAWHIWQLWREIRRLTATRRDGILLYPPASPNWVPILRDLILLPLIRGRFNKVVYIYHAGGVGAWYAASRLRYAICRLAYGRADLCLEVAKEESPPHHILGARGWAWTPYGVEAPPRPAKKSGQNRPFEVLFVGSLQEGKGVAEVLKTAEVLKKRGRQHDFRFKLVGRWFSKEFEQSALHLREILDLRQMVELPGQLTGDDKWRAFNNADVFFFPTHYESEAFPLVLIEALASGLPVVTTRWRGIPDLVSNCSAATLCDIHSPEQYADALASWHAKSNLAEVTAGEARDYYESRYQPQQFLSQIRDLIAETSRKEDIGIAPRNSGISPASALRNHKATPPELRIVTYLADQNPGYDRSFGISRMSQVVLDALQRTQQLRIETISSKTSQPPPSHLPVGWRLPWGTRHKIVRLLTDHFHPIIARVKRPPNLFYFPKGYLPLLNRWCSPSAVTIHDTIIQYDEDHYPEWRNAWEYRYWAMMLKHTLRSADSIMTVSESAKRQIITFMNRHRIPMKEITVTYEPCAYEGVPQPTATNKENYVIHLASHEPHKQTAQLVRWWHEAEGKQRHLPTLHLIGSIPPDVSELLASSNSIVKRPFLADEALQAAYAGSRALILPSEIEGFGLPALEAYYLGTPVCFVKDTSVEEILSVATTKGAFSLANPNSLFDALDEIMAMSAEEIRCCGLKLRETYAAEKVAIRMIEVFQNIRRK